MPRRLTLAAFALLLTLAAGSAQAGKKDGTLDIYFIDVEGGAATLIVTPAGESILIDSGYPDFGGRDRDRIVKVAHEQAGIEQIDHAVVSHWHLDHYGNHATLTEKIRIVNFWDRGIPDALQEDGKFGDRVADYRKASQNKSKAVKPGDMLPLKSGKTPLSVKIVTASRDVIPNTGDPNPFAKEHVAAAEDKSDNAASVSSLLQFGSFRFLTCGDLTWNIEAKLATPNNPIGKIDVFMVTHHGLPSSNNPVLVKALDPVVAIMCNGPTKGGDPKTLKTLGEVASLKHTYQLHRNIKIEADQQAPKAFIANQEKTAGCQGVFVKLSVAADGKSYTVQIGEDGKPRRYKSRG
jgi:beta-lactamase superfamily II metal-dependent hydrolase